MPGMGDMDMSKLMAAMGGDGSGMPDFGDLGGDEAGDSDDESPDAEN